MGKFLHDFDTFSGDSSMGYIPISVSGDTYKISKTNFLSDFSGNFDEYLTTASANSTYATISSLNTASGALNTAKVNTTTSITGAGLLSGGGTLSTNRTITLTAASQSQAISGVANNVASTPLSVKQAIDYRLNLLLSQQYCFFLSSSLGNDSTADGSIQHPYYTLQAIIDYVEDNAISEFSLIILDNGNYSVTKTLSNIDTIKMSVLNFISDISPISISLTLYNLSLLHIINKFENAEKFSYSLDLYGIAGTSNVEPSPITLECHNVILKEVNINGGTAGAARSKANIDTNGSDGHHGGEIIVNLYNSILENNTLNIYCSDGQVGQEGGDGSGDYGMNGGNGGNGSLVTLNIQNCRTKTSYGVVINDAGAAAGGVGGSGALNTGNNGNVGIVSEIESFSICGISSITPDSGLDITVTSSNINSTMRVFNSIIGTATLPSSTSVKCCFYKSVSGPTLGSDCIMYS